MNAKAIYATKVGISIIGGAAIGKAAYNLLSKPMIKIKRKKKKCKFKDISEEDLGFTDGCIEDFFE